MNTKIEIFKLAIKAGDEKFTEQQIQFLVECFKKAEQLSTPNTVVKATFTSGNKMGFPSKNRNGPVITPKILDGRALFIKKKLYELKPNGFSYLENKKTAVDAWNESPIEEKNFWNSKVGQKGEKQINLADDDQVGSD